MNLFSVQYQNVWFVKVYEYYFHLRAFVDASMLKKRWQKGFDQLGGFSQQGAVCTILGKDIESKLVIQYFIYTQV